MQTAMALSGVPVSDSAANWSHQQQPTATSQVEDAMDIDVDLGVRVTGSIADEQWLKAKPLIKSMYIEQGVNYKVVAKELKAVFGFCPTVKQFNRKVIGVWGFRKNNVVGHGTSIRKPQRGLPSKHVQNSSYFRQFPASRFRQMEVQRVSATLVCGQDAKSHRLITQTGETALGGATHQPTHMDEGYRDDLEIVNSTPLQHDPDWTSVLDSPDLSRLFDNLRINGIDPNDDEIPVLNINDDAHQDQYSKEEDFDNFITLAELTSNAITTKLSKIDRKLTTTPVKHVVYSRSSKMFFVKDTSGSANVWCSDFIYKVACMDYELYPFVNNVLKTRVVATSSNSIKRSLSFYEDRVEKLRPFLDRQSPALISAIKDLADQYYNECQHENAGSLYKELVDIHEETNGKDALCSLEARVEWIDNLTALNHWKIAEAEMTPVIAKLKAHPDGTQTLLSALETSGRIASNISTSNAREELERQTLYVSLHCSGWLSESSINYLDDLGRTFYDSGDNKRAEEILVTALQLAQRLALLKPSILSFLGRIYADRKEYQQALNLVEIAIKQLAADDFDGADSLRATRDYASILERQGSFEKSLLIFQELVPRCQKYWGEQNFVTLQIMAEYADTLYNAQKFADARHWYSKLLMVYDEAFGFEHFETLSICKDLGHCYVKLGEYITALELLQKTLDKVQEVSEPLSERAQEWVEKIKEDIERLQDMLSQSEDEEDSDSVLDEESDDESESYSGSSNNESTDQEIDIDRGELEFTTGQQDKVGITMRDEFSEFIDFSDHDEEKEDLYSV